LTLSQEKPETPGVTNPVDTNIPRLAFSDPKVAVAVTEPGERAVSRPVLERVAIAEGVALHDALEVTSWVELSLKVQTAASWTLSPTMKESPGATTLRDCGVGVEVGGGLGELLPPPQLLKANKVKATAIRQTRDRSVETRGEDNPR
jgi:hypothetical protein